MKQIEAELHAANILFVPPLWQKAKVRNVFSAAPSGRVYRHGYAKGKTIHLLRIAVLDNCPWGEKTKVPLSEKTRCVLRKEISARLNCPIP